MPIAMMLGMFIFPWSKIMSLIVILLFYLFSREEKKYEAKLFGELTIDQDYIKFLHHLESPDGKEKDPETLLTVRREDIEGINLDFTQEGELTGFFINVIAKGKVRSAESGADKVHFLDTMEVATFMAKDEAKWLFDCVEHLATVKKVA